MFHLRLFQSLNFVAAQRIAKAACLQNKASTYAFRSVVPGSSVLRSAVASCDRCSARRSSLCASTHPTQLTTKRDRRYVHVPINRTRYMMGVHPVVERSLTARTHRVLFRPRSVPVRGRYTRYAFCCVEIGRDLNLSARVPIPRRRRAAVPRPALCAA